MCHLRQDEYYSMRMQLEEKLRQAEEEKENAKREATEASEKAHRFRMLAMLSSPLLLVSIVLRMLRAQEPEGNICEEQA